MSGSRKHQKKIASVGSKKASSPTDSANYVTSQQSLYWNTPFQPGAGGPAQFTQQQYSQLSGAVSLPPQSNYFPQGQGADPSNLIGNLYGPQEAWLQHVRHQQQQHLHHQLQQQQQQTQYQPEVRFIPPPSQDTFSRDSSNRPFSALFSQPVGWQPSTSEPPIGLYLAPPPYSPPHEGKGKHPAGSRDDEERKQRKRAREFWTTSECEGFFEGLRQYGKDYASLSRKIGTKSTEQVCQFFHRSVRKVRDILTTRKRDLDPRNIEETTRVLLCWWQVRRQSLLAEQSFGPRPFARSGQSSSPDTDEKAAGELIALIDAPAPEDTEASTESIRNESSSFVGVGQASKLLVANSNTSGSPVRLLNPMPGPGSQPSTPPSHNHAHSSPQSNASSPFDATPPCDLYTPPCEEPLSSSLTSSSIKVPPLDDSSLPKASPPKISQSVQTELTTIDFLTAFQFIKPTERTATATATPPSVCDEGVQTSPSFSPSFPFDQSHHDPFSFICSPTNNKRQKLGEDELDFSLRELWQSGRSVVGSEESETVVSTSEHALTLRTEVEFKEVSRSSNMSESDSLRASWYTGSIA